MYQISVGQLVNLKCDRKVLKPQPQCGIIDCGIYILQVVRSRRVYTVVWGNSMLDIV